MKFNEVVCYENFDYEKENFGVFLCLTIGKQCPLCLTRGKQVYGSRSGEPGLNLR